MLLSSVFGVLDMTVVVFEAMTLIRLPANKSSLWFLMLMFPRDAL